MILHDKFRTQVLIWAGFLVSHIVLFAVVRNGNADVFPVDFEAPLSGDNYWVTLLAVVFSLQSLISSVISPRRLRQIAVQEQSVEIAQRAFISGIAMAGSVSLWGVFLAYSVGYPHFYIFMVVGFIATLFHFPRRTHLDAVSYKRLEEELDAAE